jgi:hypothetical protein
LKREVDERALRVEAARRARRAEEKAQRQREEAARLVREERELRMEAERLEMERRMAQAMRADQEKYEQEERERCQRRETEERVRRDIEETERRRRAAELEREAREQREAEERERERERRRREQERHAERLRRAHEREQAERLKQEQRAKPEPRTRGAHTFFTADGDPFAGYGFRYPGAGFSFEQFTDPSGRTYTNASFTSPPPAASGSGTAMRARRKLNTNPAPEDVGPAFTAYEQRWAGLGALSPTPAWTFSTIPWPVTYPISTAAAIEPLAVRRFLLATVHSEGKSKKERVRAAMLRWHPDKFCPKWLGKVRDGDQQAVREGVNAVARILQDLQAECA